MKIFYLSVTGSAGSANYTPLIILLHGAGSSSLIWNKLKTLHLISALGHRAIAVDLPGTVLHNAVKC